MSKKRKYFQCHLCAWITTDTAHALSVIPNYCPRCKEDSVMLTPRTMRECVSTQSRINLRKILSLPL